jgi:hypothetical protein
MGYAVETLTKLLATCRTVFGADFRGLSMFEYGNQESYTMGTTLPFLHSHGYTGTSPILKYFFEFLGFKHVSVDYNGRDGAHNLDVRQDITGTITDRFDVLTNLGFTEHVGEYGSATELMTAQYAAFKNLHDLGKCGALYYHVVPFTRHWYKHGVCDYSLEFFAELCRRCGYEVVVPPFVEDYHPEHHASVFYKKVNDAPFISFEEFCALPGLRSTAND